MNKSYRCTYEIMEFALKIQPCEDVELVERHGEPVTVLKPETLSEEREELLRRVEEFLARGDGAKLGVLCKNHRQAEKWEQWLAGRVSDRERLHLFTYDSREFFDGVLGTSVALAKGLEFDSVILPDVNGDNYADEYDRGLLYVACTRAMHSLTVLCVETGTPFLTACVMKIIMVFKFRHVIIKLIISFFIGISLAGYCAATLFALLWSRNKIIGAFAIASILF